MAEMRIFRSRAFKSWYENLSVKGKRIVDARVDLARKQSLLRNFKELDRDFSFYEFKWRNGRRVYFSLLTDETGTFMLLLAGGNKNSQSADITLSKNIIIKARESIHDKD